MKELADAMEKTEAARETVPPAARTHSFRIAQKWFGYALLAFCLSFIIPALIVMAPVFARTYVHVWKVALGQEPDCEYPAAQWPAQGFDCRSPDGALGKKTDRLPGGPRFP